MLCNPMEKYATKVQLTNMWKWHLFKHITDLYNSGWSRDTMIQKYSLLHWSHMTLTFYLVWYRNYVILKKILISWHRTAETNPVVLTWLVTSIMLYNLSKKCSLWASSSLVSDAPQIYSLFLYFLIVFPCVFISALGGSTGAIFSVSSEILFYATAYLLFLIYGLSSSQVVIATISCVDKSEQPDHVISEFLTKTEV